MNDAPCSDLLWDAVRYVAGELTEQEAAAFEDRLESDLAAAEALAEAVVLSESLVRVRAEARLRGVGGRLRDRQVRVGSSVQSGGLYPPLRSGVAAASRRGTWSGLAAISAAGLLLACWSLSGPGVPSGDVQPVSVPVADAGAAVDLPLESTLSVWVALIDAESAPVEEAVETALDADGSDEADVPDWMFAALLTPADEVTDGLPPDSLDEESL